MLPKRVVSPTLRDLARDLRNHPTPHEQIFWHAVRGRQLDGFRFLRQYRIFLPFGDRHQIFIVDFYCRKKRLIVEIDGAIHSVDPARDTQRDEALKLAGYHVIHFTNAEIEQNLQEVLERVRTT